MLSQNLRRSWSWTEQTHHTHLLPSRGGLGLCSVGIGGTTGIAISRHPPRAVGMCDTNLIIPLLGRSHARHIVGAAERRTACNVLPSAQPKPRHAVLGRTIRTPFVVSPGWHQWDQREPPKQHERERHCISRHAPLPRSSSLHRPTGTDGIRLRWARQPTDCRLVRSLVTGLRAPLPPRRCPPSPGGGLRP